jgi:hypothetical protein
MAWNSFCVLQTSAKEYFTEANDHDLIRRTIHSAISKTSISFTLKFFEPVKNVSPSIPVSFV